MIPGQSVMRVVGPDRYCPDCGRLLLEVDDHGGFRLGGPDVWVTIEGNATWDPEVDSQPDEIEGFPSAYCMRRRCRLRRWARREKLDLPPKPPEVVARDRLRLALIVLGAALILNVATATITVVRALR